MLDYGETANIPFTNTASLSYTPVEGSADSKSAEADGAYGIPTNGGTLTITEQLRIGYNSNPVNYNEFYASVFTGGASFAVYKAEDWENNAPKATDANGQPVVPVATTSVTNSATATVTLAPGDYLSLIHI